MCVTQCRINVTLAVLTQGTSLHCSNIIFNTQLTICIAIATVLQANSTVTVTLTDKKKKAQ